MVSVFHVNILFSNLYIVHDHRPGKIAMAMTAKERSQTKKRRRRAEEVKSRQAGRREGGLLWRQNGKRAGEREAREGGKGAAERNLRWQGEPEGKIQAGGTPKHHLPIFKIYYIANQPQSILIEMVPGICRIDYFIEVGINLVFVNTVVMK